MQYSKACRMHFKLVLRLELLWVICESSDIIFYVGLQPSHTGRSMNPKKKSTKEKMLLKPILFSIDYIMPEVFWCSPRFLRKIQIKARVFMY